MIEFAKCDLLEADVAVVAQSVNCQCKMQSGLALAIKNKWPEVERDDNMTAPADKNKLGIVRLVKIEKPSNSILYVANLYSQFNWGRSQRQVDYEYLYQCLTGLERKVLDIDLRLNVGIPYNLSSDRAGGDWDVVLAMINSVFKKSPINVLICKKG
jgi:O-acetyl-ADP-ribose deacetylase (regulator of RNase III)